MIQAAVQKLPLRASVLLAWQAAYSGLLMAARLGCSAPLTRAVTTYTPKLKQEMLLHKIGAFWDGPGWTKHRRAVWRAITVRLCRATSATRSVGVEGSVADAVHELVAAVRAAHRLGRLRLVGELLGLVAALEEARQ